MKLVISILTLFAIVGLVMWLRKMGIFAGCTCRELPNHEHNK